MLINVLLYTFVTLNTTKKESKKKNNQNGKIKRFVVFKIYDFCVNLMFSVDN